MDLPSVQALITESLHPLLTRIEALETENKQFREIINKIETPKAANTSRIASSKTTYQKTPTSTIIKPTVDKKQVVKKEEKETPSKIEEKIESVVNQYSIETEMETKKAEKSKVQTGMTPKPTKKDEKCVPKRPTTGQSIRSPQVDKKAVGPSSKTSISDCKKECKPVSAQKNDKSVCKMEKIEQMIEEVAKCEQIEVHQVEKKEPLKEKQQKKEKPSPMKKTEPKKTTTSSTNIKKESNIKKPSKEQNQNPNVKETNAKETNVKETNVKETNDEKKAENVKAAAESKIEKNKKTAPVSKIQNAKKAKEEITKIGISACETKVEMKVE